MKNKLNIKYYKKVRRKDGSINHFIAIPPYIEAVTLDRAQSFESLADARAYSLKVQAKYASHTRNNRKTKVVSAGSVRKLVESYRSSEKYFNLKPRSVASYELMIDTALNTILPFSPVAFGDMEARLIDKKTVQTFIAHVRANFSHHRALHTVKVMKLIWVVGENDGLISGNPWRHSAIKGIDPRETIWTQTQVDTFISTADEMGLHSMGTLALMCYTMCQRPGDIRSLTWGHIKEDTFEFRQEKTDTEVYIPIPPILRDRFNEFHAQLFPEGHSWETILKYEVTGKSYTQWDYGKIAKKIKAKAGLPKELRIGDLRRTGTTKLADSGCTEDQIMSVTGHKSREMVSVYVKRSQATAQSAMQKAWG
jgi:integrase